MRLSHGEFREQIRSKGLVLTPQRWTVYETLMGMHGHPDVDDVFKKVAVKLPSISLNTVYTTLSWLEGNGFVHSVLMRDTAKKYDTTCEPHHHLLCVKCGGLTDFSGSFGRDILPRAVRANHDIVGVNITVNILCEECKGQMGKNAMRRRKR